MATIRELLEEGNLGGSEKVASVATAADADGMDKLAMQLGLFADTPTEKVAEFPPKKEEKDEKEDDDKDEDEGEKKAGIPSGSLHSMLFPDSVIGGGAEKTAAEKAAAAEEAMGGMAYDQFTAALDGFVEKLASEIISGNPHGDSQPANRLPNNKPANAKEKIDTAPQVDNRLPAKNDAATVGHFEQKTAAAFRKQWLLANLEN